ncbi:MAG: LapA family protein [Deltaproteobacteria bacterium]|nr:LapA family protein [Deltaproteobacteria bacterium]
MLYIQGMQYIKMLIIIVIMIVLIIFGISNTQEYVLSFLNYQLMTPLQMWILLIVFFVAGMIPIFFIGLPEKAAFFRTTRSLRGRIRTIEKELESLDLSIKT